MYFIKNVIRVFSATLILFSLCLSFQAFSGSNDINCDISQKQHVFDLVKSDFLTNLMPRYDKMATKLGTNNPEIFFDPILTASDGAYLSNFTAVGVKGKAYIIGIVDCKTNKIEYSVDNTK